MVFTEGLTVSGVRRRFESEQPQPPDDLLSFVAEVQAAQAKAAQTRAGQSHDATPAVAPVVTPPAVASSAPAVDARVLDVRDTSPGGPAVPAETRAQIGKLKDDMRSLLDLLGGDDAPTPPAPPAAAAKRTRRG